MSQFIPVPELVKVSVDVETGYTHIHWKTNNSSETQYYLVYQSIDSLFGSDDTRAIEESQTNEVGSEYYQYIYPFNYATTGSRGFTVLAHRGSETSLKDRIDSTIFLTGSYDTCKAQVELNWNAYNGWKNQIAYYGIYLSVEGDPWTLVKKLPEDSLTTAVTYTREDTELRIFVAAIRNNVRRDSSSSNAYSNEIKMAAHPDYVFANYSTINNESQEISFSLDPNGNMKEYQLFRSDDSDGNYEYLTSFSNTATIQHIDDSNPLEGPYYYKIKGVNYCNEVFDIDSQNIASTVVLNVTFDNSNNTATLNWNDYFNYSDVQYTIERKFGDEEFEFLVQIDSNIYQDNLTNVISDTKSKYSAQVTYRIVAMKGLQNHLQNSAEGISNEVVIELPAEISFDYNAISPRDNRNNIFAPTLNIVPSNYLFRIFDANGTLVFEQKNDTPIQWNGKTNGKYVHEGVYIYMFSYTNEYGNEQVLTGNVTVIYP